ncbi:MAG: hypothetical protein KAJ66_00905 [Candidatus Omnitrophica bacterium]|nr:hypothetical protein [Candidatus Omnitrophota bacterium]
MIAKNKILRHILWGGIFGLVSGIIASYAGGFIFSRVPRPFPLYYEQYIIYYKYIIFLSPGLFLGLALGIADKSIRKTFYGIIGGLAGGVVFYLITQICKGHILGSVAGLIAFFGLPFTPVVYAIFISLSFGIMHRSFHRALRAMIGGAIALLIVYPLTFFLLWLYSLSIWAMGGTPQVEKVVPILLLEYILLGVALVLGIYLGDKK